MALFGAPVAQEDHAIRACYAALRMQQRITAYGDDVQRTHGIPILIRVGLNSGEVVLRPLGSDPSALSAVGQTVHLASRLEQLAKPGTVLASAATIAMTGRRVRTRSIGPVNVKGLAQPVEVFEVVGGSALRAGRVAEIAIAARRPEGCPAHSALGSVSQGPRGSSRWAKAGIGKSPPGRGVRGRPPGAQRRRLRQAQPCLGPRAGASASTCSGLLRPRSGRCAGGRARQGRRRDACARSGSAHVAPVLWQLGARRRIVPSRRRAEPA
jgi:hypothetical protein